MEEETPNNLPFGQLLDNIDPARLSGELEIFTLLTLLGFVPILLVAATTFTRNIIVFSFLRTALGLQQSPPNIVLVTLALFLTFFVMSPVFSASYSAGIEPYLASEMNLSTGLTNAWQPFREFMISQTGERDIELIYELSKTEIPATADLVANTKLIPAYLLSELKTAFKIGFIIYLPFLLIDIVMAAILMSLGMIMVPPITISLPLKIMLFVVIDGWGLIAETLVKSAMV